MATNELNYCTDRLRTGGVPDYGKTVDYFNGLWNAYYDKGAFDGEKPTIPTSAGQGGNHVDGMSASCEYINDEGELEYEEMQAYAAAAFPPRDRRGTNTLAGLEFCWNCLGWGHRKNRDGVKECASPLFGSEGSGRERLNMDEAAAKLKDREMQQNRDGSGARGAGRGLAGRGRGRRHALC